MNRRPKVLIVGGAGFIGSHVNKYMHTANFDTYVLDNLQSGHKKAVVRGTFIQGDVADKDLLHDIFTKHRFEAVMHFASYLDVGESMQNPLKYYENNVANTITLLNAMQKHGVKHFIFSSSAAVYGIPEKNPISESHPKNPISPYGKTKVAIENILSDMAHAYDFTFCSLRYFNAAGGDVDREIPNLKKHEHNLIPVLLKNIKRGNVTAKIFGTDYDTIDGTCIRDYVHVSDLANAHALSLKSLLDGAPSNIFNLGTGVGYTVKQVIHAIENVTKIPLQIEYTKRRRGDPPILLADAKKAKTALNWHPKYTNVEDMVLHAWDSIAKITPHEIN